MRNNIIIFLFSSLYCWGNTGFYSGTFDPPTVAEITSVRNSFQQFDLDKLIVMIDRLSPQAEGYNTSAIERAEMLRAELKDLGDCVHIIAEPWSGKEQYLELIADREDLYLIEKKEEASQAISTTIDEIIKKEHFYADVPKSMIPLKRALLEEAFQSFLREISLIFPDENLLDLRFEQFQPSISELGWVDRFVYSVIQGKQFKPDKADVFGKKAEKVLISSERGKPYAKIHCLNQVFFKPTTKPAATLFPFILPSVPKNQTHTFDVDIYCSDRFPKALFTSCLFQEEDTYFHLGSTDEAIAYHQSEGFTEIFEVHSQAVRKLRTYHLLRNPDTSEIRFVVGNLHGEDTLHHVGYQLNAVTQWKRVNLVRHATASGLFKENQNCSAITFQPTDALVIGFKNAISRLIEKNSDWHKTSLSASGLQIDLYENNRTKGRVVLSKCVYGDQLLELLDFFYTRGVRKFQYFGTAGSLSSDIHIGDIIIPLAFSTPQNSSLPFCNAAADLLQQTQNRKVRPVYLHGWAQSPVQETKIFLEELQKKGNESIDVESRYYGEFFDAHPDTFASMILFISDEPFGGITLDHFNTMDHYVDDAFNSVIDEMCLY